PACREPNAMNPLRRFPLWLAALLLPALAHAADADWPRYGRDEANQRLAPITRLNPKTVGRLVPKWIYQSGVNGTFQATPIVV
ncbi:hypothetical protein ACO1ME_14085, partial [Staphylococcus aureus]